MKKWLVRLKKYEIVASALMIICIAGVFAYNKFTGGEVEIVDFTIFSSIILVTVLGVIGKGLSQLIVNKFEDYCKLQQGHQSLNKLYKADNLLVHRNPSGNKVKFPLIQDYRYEADTKIKIIDSQSMYQVPDDINNIYGYLLESHVSSVTYNQLNIRCDKWEYNQEDKTLYLHTSRTNYYNGLVTNRSLDYPWPDDRTTRDMYAYGPFAPKLEESKLSNHLGLHGLVESSDGYIPFVHRGKKVSIAKNTLGTSVGASLKAQSVLRNTRKVTKEGLVAAFVDEIKEELNVDMEHLHIGPLEEMLIGLYRELAEGGKPQFLFYTKCKLNREEMEKAFHQGVRVQKKKRTNKSKVIMDGTKVTWIKKEDLLKCEIMPHGIVYDGQKYGMTPSFAGSVAMAVECLSG